MYSMVFAMFKRNEISWLPVAKLSILPLAVALMLIASSAQAQWTLLDNFEGLAVGDAIEGSSGPGATWTGNGTSTGTAEIDPSDPSNLALRISGAPSSEVLRAEFSAQGNSIVAGATGTLFFRFRTPVAAVGGLDHVFGLTDNPTITNFNFKSGLRYTVPAGVNNLDLRDGINPGYESVASLADNTWYSLWMVSTNTNPGTFETYLQSNTDSNFATQTLLTSGGDPFDYRINGITDITNAYFRSSNNTGGVEGNDLYFDDIYINSSAVDLSDPLAVPEPTGVVVLLAGMGMVFARRRK